jgi:hypothetical protein
MSETSKLYFHYTYNCGGLGDLIKGASTAWYISQQIGRAFDILFSHELGVLYPNYMQTPKKIQNHIFVSLIDRKESNDTINMLKNIPRDKKIIMSSNTSLDFFRTQEDYLKKMKPFFHEFYIKYLPIKRPIWKIEPFQVLHCRMGDLYLNEATIKSDNRIKSLDEMNKKVQYFVNNLNIMPTLICCDSSEYQKKLLTLIPDSFAVNSNPYHFAYNTKKMPQRDIIESIEKTLQEHELMTRGERIFKVVYSGFPIIGALIGNKPLYILKENGYEEYKCDYTS